MHDFTYRFDHLYCEDVPIKEICLALGTPFYLYSHHTLVRHFRVFNTAFSGVPHLICYAVKANSNLAILRIFAMEGSGADIVSGGELFRVLKSGMDPRKVVYAGVGKTAREMQEALRANILLFNVESDEELKLLNTIAGEMKLKAPVGLRVNPDIDPQTHPYVATGLKESKFGFDINTAQQSFKLAQSLPHIDLIGIHKHIGSQILKVETFREALEKLGPFIEKLKLQGIDIKYVDIGGGLGITYRDETPPHPNQLAEALLPILNRMNCTIIFEPGRVIVGNAGVLISRVLYTKSSPKKEFLIVDAAMNDLIRPSLYGSFQGIQPVDKKKETCPKIIADVVGPICESGDFLAKDRELPLMQPGEFIAILGAGAYGFSMASNYNSRPRAPEVLVKGDSWHVIRQRESYEQLIVNEVIPPFLA